jgi:hypothetical protein
MMIGTERDKILRSVIVMVAVLVVDMDVNREVAQRTTIGAA